MPWKEGQRSVEKVQTKIQGPMSIQGTGNSGWREKVGGCWGIMGHDVSLSFIWTSVSYQKIFNSKGEWQLVPLDASTWCMDLTEETKAS